MLAEILARGSQEIGAVIHPYPEGEEVSGGQRAHPGDRRVGLHSYYLPDAETLRRKGVAVFTRLKPDATTWLANHDK